MKNERKASQKGAIAVFTMIAMVFFLITIMSVYMISSKRAQTQTESMGMIQEQYYAEEGEENKKYAAKIATDDEMIPIYTKEQLWSVGNNVGVEIEGKVYDFSQTDLTKYELKNDIVINISELEATQIINEPNITKNNYEIYYYYEGDYYEVALDGTSDLSINGMNFKYKNLSKSLGYVTDGLMLHYDGIKNTALGHDSFATKWKDLSGNGNDGILNGCTWENNDLNFDGVDDSVETKNTVDYKSSKAITVQFLDLNGILNNSQVGMLFESSSNYGNVQGAYYIDTREFGGEKDLVFATKMLGANLKIGKNILSNKSQVYTVICNNSNSYDNYISFFEGINKVAAEDVRSDLKYNLTDSSFANYKFYIGSRNSTEHFAKMNLASIRIYNKALSQEEIKKNYEIDKARFGIQ